jgi:hypothetical protein
LFAVLFRDGIRLASDSSGFWLEDWEKQAILAAVHLGGFGGGD